MDASTGRTDRAPEAGRGAGDGAASAARPDGEPGLVSDGRIGADLDDEGDDESDGGLVGAEPDVDVRTALVGAEDGGLRIDAFVARGFSDLSRSAAERLIEGGLVSLDGRAAAKPSVRVAPGQLVLVRVPPAEPSDLVPQALPLTIVFEDGDVAVVDKPAGLVVHPAPGHPTGTLANALRARYPDLAIGGSLRPGIVHRLDRDTSGLMVVAKHDRAMASLVDQMKRHEVLKEYVALLGGRLALDSGTIDAPIGRDPRDRKRMAVVATGREARTHFRVLERLRASSLVEARLETGRTHQIRVHFASLGHPLVGDATYGGDTRLLSRQFLHARRLGFRLPSSGEWVCLESALPDDLAECLGRLRAAR